MIAAAISAGPYQLLLMKDRAVITASQNFIETAEQVSGGVRISEVQSPSSDATEAELGTLSARNPFRNGAHSRVAWHFHLPSMTSGYMYYGDSDDMPDKQSVACNIAIEHAQNAINQTAFVGMTAAMKKGRTMTAAH